MADSTFTKKVYVVQKGNGPVIGVKLAFTPAHALAKKHAPSKVWFALADKTEEPNAVEYGKNHPV